MQEERECGPSLAKCTLSLRAHEHPFRLLEQADAGGELLERLLGGSEGWGEGPTQLGSSTRRKASASAAAAAWASVSSDATSAAVCFLSLHVLDVAFVYLDYLLLCFSHQSQRICFRIRQA